MRAAGTTREETFHGLRHHYVSLLIRHGESIRTVQARLGRASASETLDAYSHLWPDSDDRTREAVDMAWPGAVVPLCAPNSWRPSSRPAFPQDTGLVAKGRRTSRPVRRVLSPGASRRPDGRSSI
jgi:hypothetical protein